MIILTEKAIKRAQHVAKKQDIPAVLRVVQEPLSQQDWVR